MTTATHNATNTNTMPNGVNAPVVTELIEAVKQDPAKGMTHWGVTTRWMGGCVSETDVTGYEIGGRRVKQDYRIRIDEPRELGGSDTMPNPQEYLLAATNACMMVTYVALATLQGITLESLEIETEGEIDLRGLFGLDESVNPGYNELTYTVRMKGDGTEEQFQQIHEMVKATSPNYANMARAIAMRSRLVVE